jgi:hypothetical protein
MWIQKDLLIVTTEREVAFRLIRMESRERIKIMKRYWFPEGRSMNVEKGNPGICEPDKRLNIAQSPWNAEMSFKKEGRGSPKPGGKRS